MKKTYLFATYTNYNKPLTGAHRRYIELISDLSKYVNIELISGEIPQLFERDNVRYPKIIRKNPEYRVNKIIQFNSKQHGRTSFYQKATNLGYDISEIIKILQYYHSNYITIKS